MIEKTLAGIVILIALGAASSHAQGVDAAKTEASSSTVSCYDEARKIIQTTLRGACAGTILSTEEAKSIRQNILRERARRASDLKPDARAAPALAMRFGTAFAVNDKGQFLSARHVVDGCTSLFIADAKGNRWPASIAALDPDLDMALLEMETNPANAEDLPAAFDYVMFRTALPGIDEPVMAVGFPEQGLPRIRPDRRKGQISALSDQGPDSETPFYLAFKGSVRGGNSGGPLFDEAGYVTGMVIAKANTAAIFQTSGTLVRNTAFAISAPVLMRFLNDHKAPFWLQNDRDVPTAPTVDDGPKTVGRVICQP
ncbi:hypothetical protein JCM17846_04730 [Iodidimonas nitroreducens]|uniref:Serine protease n=1 Tax=Iodidimonas nitroreducens TaxID=1236968 RepID=A0A5A7N3D6_9PROT|nr:serine protease [Iodidimonas nitroreducens]GAK34541.1 putative protein [alpha proteobacterium Q-1]GER02791.1 hypothetical protein JCM17846_04730 [Iodidimonas nitroreducens]